MQPELSITSILAALVALIATITDVRTGKIFNVITFPAMLIGIIARGVQWYMTQPESGIAAAVAGAFNGFLGFLLGMVLLGVFKVTIMRQFGGGDIKLMGALGAFVGPAMIMGTFLYYCLSFGVYTCTVMAMAFPWNQAIVAYISKAPQVMNMDKFNAVRKAPLPVAPFILAGLLATIVFYEPTMWLFGLKEQISPKHSASSSVPSGIR
ncbi:MAG TPA: A24 family peptidase [Candidatus Obscuribacterales bacterium]